MMAANKIRFFAAIFQIIAVVFGESNVTQWPENYKVQNKESFDYVIVGAGSAGATLAARLAELPELKILLIEAGGDPPIDSVRPGLVGNLAKTEYDWDFASEPETFSSRSQITPGVQVMPRGKMLGGTSSFNFMVFACGAPGDYDSWASDGFTSWNYKTVLKYFKKMQNLQDDTLDKKTFKKYHSTLGPTIVTKPKRSSKIEENKLDLYLDLFKDIGYKTISDYNTNKPLGFSKVYFSHSKAPNAKRSSTAQSYLVPNANKKNLHIVKNAYVTKVLINKSKIVYGVEISLNNKTMIVYASKEIIISAGALNSPKILMASGIGPKDQIKKLGVNLVADLPVGRELQDHANLQLYFSGAEETNPDNITDLNEIPSALINGFFSINDKKRPEYQIIASYHFANKSSFEFYCKSYYFVDGICQPGIDINKKKEIFLVTLVLLHPKSRGRVEIKSVDPNVPPSIYYGLLSDNSDVVSFRKGIKKMLKLLKSSYMKKVSSELIKPIIPECDSFKFKSDEYWDCYIRNVIVTTYHPSGTCGMGRVVDEDLRVYNVKNLRVVDGSVFRDMPSGNTNAPIIMMAEKIADIIKEGLKSQI